MTMPAPSPDRPAPHPGGFAVPLGRRAFLAAAGSVGLAVVAAVSLDHALASGRPTVVVFATPLLCTSRMCGPVVDEALAAAKATDPKAANFVDVEIYPQRDTNRPAPAFKAWGFQIEPWTIVTDRRGVMRDRFEGPVAASQIKAALRPLL